MKARAQPLSPKFLKAYFGRRILRIEPLYIVLMVATWLLLVVAGYKPDQTTHFDAAPHALGTRLIGSLFYLHDVIWETYPRLFPPGWSLEVEVRFYLMAPVLFWAFFKTQSAPGRIAIGALGLFGGAFLSLTAPQAIDPVHTDISILRFFHFFWLGILLAHSHGCIVQKTQRISPKLIGALGWFGLACYVVMPSAFDHDLVSAIAIRAATLVSLTTVFVAAFAHGSSVRAFCERPWISVIGGACYSIYLTHLQAIQAATSILARLTPHAGLGLLSVYLVVETIIVVAIGLVFYGVIERSFMMKDWPTRFWVRLKSSFDALGVGVHAQRSPIGPQTLAERLESSREPR